MLRECQFFEFEAESCRNESTVTERAVYAATGQE